MKTKYQKTLASGVIIFLVALVIWFWAFPWLSEYFTGLAEKTLTTVNARTITNTTRRELSLAQFFNPRNPAPYYWQGYLASRNSDFKTALSQLTKALEKNLETARPDLYKDSLFRMGHTLAKLGDPEKSALYYGEFLKRYGGKEPFFTYYRLAFLDFELLGKPEKARDLLETFKKLGPTSPPITTIQMANYHHLLGRVKFYFGDNKGALNEANQALKYVDENIDPILYQRVRILRSEYLGALGDFKAAQKELDGADKIVQGYDVVDCTKATIAFNYEKNSRRAIEIAKPIVEGTSTRPPAPGKGCLPILVYAYLSLKDKTSAQKYYEQFKKYFGVFESAFQRLDFEKMTKALSS